jgi:hypothetical protein
MSQKILIAALLVGAASFLLAKNSDFVDYAQKSSGKCKKALPSLSPEQRLTQDDLAKLARQFYDYVTTSEEFKNDDRVRYLKLRWNKNVMLSDFPGDDANVLGSFNKLSGCLLFRYMPQKSKAEQLGIMLHELAHSSGANHDGTWRDAFLYFANIATKKLGWIVALKCPTVCKSYNICSKDLCPLCDWEPSFGGCSLGNKL